MRAVIVRSAVSILLFTLFVMGGVAIWAYYVVDHGDSPMLIVAHQGDMANEPGNTLEALRSAASAGAHGIEFDILPSSDGTWYLGRDQTMRMMSNADVEAGNDPDPPQLADALDVLSDYDGVLMLHVKSPLPEHHSEIARLLVDRGLVGRSWILTHVHDGAAAVKAVETGIPTALVANPAQSPLGSPAVDAWLIDIHTHQWIAAIAASFHPDSLMVFVSPGRGDERQALENARRWGAVAFISNRLSEALEWSDTAQPSIRGTGASRWRAASTR